jgi:hypothetical protein
MQMVAVRLSEIFAINRFVAALFLPMKNAVTIMMRKFPVIITLFGHPQ